MSKIMNGVDDAMMLTTSMYLDDSSAYPKRLRTSLSKLMDKQMDYNMSSALPIGTRSRSRSIDETNATPITSMLRSASPIRHASGSSNVNMSMNVKPPMMYKKEYLLKNNNSNNVLRKVPMAHGVNSPALKKNGSLSSSRTTSEHNRGQSNASQLSGRTQYVDFEPAKLSNRFPSSESYISSTTTISPELDSRPGEEDNSSNNNNKRNSILSNFMNDEQMWLNDKIDFQYPDDIQLDREKIDLTIKKLELKIDELKLDNDKLHLENMHLSMENDSLKYQNRTLFDRLQAIPRISESDFIVRKSQALKDNILDSLQFKSDTLIKAAVEGKIKELEKELAKYRHIKKVTQSRLSSRKTKVKYLNINQLDKLVECESEEEEEKTQEHESTNNDISVQAKSTFTTTEQSSDTLQYDTEMSRLKHGFNLRIKLASIPQD